VIFLNCFIGHVKDELKRPKRHGTETKSLKMMGRADDQIGKGKENHIQAGLKICFINLFLSLTHLTY